MDVYHHEDPTIFYTTENIIGSEENCTEHEELIQNYNSQLTNHCTCSLCTDVCSCLQSCGLNYVYSKDNPVAEFVLHENASTMHVIIECNDFCSCESNCSNRVVQKGPIKSLYVKHCDGKGLGLFTNQLIPKGSFICEYAGEIITKNEARKRDLFNNLNSKANYICCLNEIIGDKKIQTYIDPSIFGNIGRYINHSCEPNSFIIPIRVNNPIPKLSIFSNSVIYPGTEISFDYGVVNTTESTEAEVRSRKICLCKSHLCRGFLPFNDF